MIIMSKGERWNVYTISANNSIRNNKTEKMFINFTIEFDITISNRIFVLGGERIFHAGIRVFHDSIE